MKTLKQIGLLAITLWHTAYAGPIHSKLTGTWDLKDFVLISQDGEESLFCEGAKGKIIYEHGGGVAVAINCEDPEKFLFYSGTFEIKGDDVIHEITNSNRADLIGKKLSRKIELTDTRLLLTGRFGNGSLRIEWTKPLQTASKESRENLAYLTHLKLKPGTQDAFLKEVKKIVAFSRSEPGNIAWFVQQSIDDPTEVVFYTRWVNQAAIEWHLSAPPLAKYIQNTSVLLAEPAKLTKYRPLDLNH